MSSNQISFFTKPGQKSGGSGQNSGKLSFMVFSFPQIILVLNQSPISEVFPIMIPCLHQELYYPEYHVITQPKKYVFSFRASKNFIWNSIITVTWILVIDATEQQQLLWISSISNN